MTQITPINEIQEQFARYVVTGALNPNGSFAGVVNGHLNAYRDSFLGRVIGALPVHSLREACQLFGDNFVRELAGRYLEGNPPSTWMMEECLAGLPQFIAHADSSLFSSMVSTVIELCLSQLDLMQGPDPVQGQNSTNDLLSLFLRIEHRLSPLVDFDLHQIWSLAPSGRPLNLDALDLTEPTAVLLVKENHSSVHCVCVSKNCFAFVKGLQDGLSVGAALDILPETSEGIQREFKGLMDDLVDAKAFV